MTFEKKDDLLLLCVAFSDMNAQTEAFWAERPPTSSFPGQGSGEEAEKNPVIISHSDTKIYNILNATKGITSAKAFAVRISKPINLFTYVL